MNGPWLVEYATRTRAVLDPARATTTNRKPQMKGPGDLGMSKRYFDRWPTS